MPSGLCSFEDLDRLALAKLHDRLLPAGPGATPDVALLGLGLDLDDVHGLDVDAEQLFDRLPDLRLVRVRVHLERVLALVDQLVALLGHDRGEQNLVRMKAHWALPCTCSSAGSEMSSERAQTTWVTSSSDGTVMTTRSRLRNDLIRPSSSSCATTRIGRSLSHFSTRPRAALVEGSESS